MRATENTHVHYSQETRRRPTGIDRLVRALSILLTMTGLTVGIVVVGIALQQRGLFAGDPTAATDVGPGQPGDAAGDSLQAAEPTAVRVPSIDVNAATIPLGLSSDGAIEVPEDFAQTGWWRDGPEPGETGPAVILGHVDSFDGPAVFFELGNLAIGDPIHVDRADGTTVSYVVERIEQHAKDDFPTAAVYGPTDGSELRLVTCGGTFDPDARSYKDNVIVFAVPAA